MLASVGKRVLFSSLALPVLALGAASSEGERSDCRSWCAGWGAGAAGAAGAWGAAECCW